MAINCSGYRDLNRGRAFGFGPFFVLNPSGCELEPEQLFWLVLTRFRLTAQRLIYLILSQ